MHTVDWQQTIQRYAGRHALGGVDLSSVSDLTCLVWVIPWQNDPEGFDVIMRTWCPEAQVYSRRNKYKDQYQVWEKQGYLETTPGNAIDYDYVRQRIVEDTQILDVEAIGVDRLFQGYGFCMQLDEDLGGTENAPVVIACGMGYLSMAAPCQELEARLLKKKVNHGGNPILRFMADSVAVSFDPAGNRKPNKDKSQGKIDGIIGLLLGLDRLMRSKPKPGLNLWGFNI